MKSPDHFLLGKIAWSTTLAVATVFQTIGITPVVAAERSVLVPTAQPVVTVGATSDVSQPNRVKLKWRKRQPSRSLATPSQKAEKSGLNRSFSANDRAQGVTIGRETRRTIPPQPGVSDAILPSRVSAPRILPTADRVPTISLQGPRIQLAQDTGSAKGLDPDVGQTPRQPSVDDFFSDPPDLPRDRPQALSEQDDLPPEINPDLPPQDQPNADDTPPSGDEDRSADGARSPRCEEEANKRDEEINGSKDGKQIGAIEYCEQSRNEINALNHRVVDLSIDISPPKPEGGFQCDRQWKDIAGKPLVTGRPDNYDVIAGTVTIRSTDGELHDLLFEELGLEDRKHFLAMYRLPMDCTLTGQGRQMASRNWAPSTFTWTASALCSKPNYFEQVHLERYGHSPGPIIGPVLSSAHFFATFPILPYKMGLTPPNECVYTLGYYRPGNCAPYLLDPIPLSVRAGLWQAGAWVGGVALIP